MSVVRNWNADMDVRLVVGGDRMNQTGSGGIGAVSSGISESVIWIAILVVVVLLVLGIWKLAKFLWTMFG
jgi:hypothetical protein